MHEPKFDDVPLGVEYAVAVLRWGAAQTEAAAYGDYRAAVDAVLELAAEPYEFIARDAVVEAIREHVPAPESLIWALRQDASIHVPDLWPVGDAITMARQPGARCAWTDRPAGARCYDLRVTAADGTATWFYGWYPERWAVSSPARRERNLAEIAQYLSDGEVSSGETPGSEESES